MSVERGRKENSLLTFFAFLEQFITCRSISTGTLGGDDVYLNDGGIVDTTGIVTLLQKKVPKIVAFYNNNDPLESLSSIFAYLFGVEVTTDTMNSLEGWELGQVFDGGVYEEVLANLTLSGGLTDASDDTAAASAGVAVGQLYRNGSVVMIRVS